MPMFSKLFRRSGLSADSIAELKEQREFLQLIEPGDLLKRHADLVTRLEQALSDESLWQDFVYPNLLTYAGMCLRLPMAAQGPFSEADGLLRAGLSAAGYSVAVMESFVQPANNILRQDMLQTRLKTAALLAALYHFLPTLLFNLRISPSAGTDNDTFWNPNESALQKIAAFCPYAESFYAYLTRQRQHQRSVRLSWQTQTTKKRLNDQLILFVLPQLLAPRSLIWFTQAGPEPLMSLFAHLTQSGKEDDPVNVAANLGAFQACEKEREAIGRRLGGNTVHAGWECLVIGIIRSRVGHSWLINSKDSPLKLANDGLFLQWPDVCPVILNDLKALGVHSLPNDPSVWAGMLCQAGITLKSRTGEAKCFIAVTPNAKLREAVKLNADYFFDPSALIGLKVGKRDFEVTPDAATQSGLPQLNRQLLLQKTAASGFTPINDQAAAATSKATVWSLAPAVAQTVTGEAQQYLNALCESLTQHTALAHSLMLDEGVVVFAELVNALDQDFQLVTLALLHADAIYRTDKNEPAWFDLTIESTGNVHALIIPGNFFTVHRFNEVGQVPMNYSDYFDSIFHRRPKMRTSLVIDEATEVHHD